MIALPGRIDPMKEVADQIAKIPIGPKSPFGDACQLCGGELAGATCKGCNAACFPVVDLPGLVLFPHQVNLMHDGTAEVMFQPSAGGQDWLDCSNYAAWSAGLMHNIATNLGIPAAALEGNADYSGRTVASEHFQEQIRNLAEAFAAAANRMTDLFLGFVDTLYDVACEEYLKYHRRLPGSERTARLRKKRRARVLAWMRDRYHLSLRGQPMGFKGPLSFKWDTPPTAPPLTDEQVDRLRAEWGSK